MAFQTKSFVAIVASAINRIRRTSLLFNDFNIGSVARTMIEAFAQEIDDLYQQMVRGLIDAIQVSVYNTFNFAADPPVSATGAIRVVVTSSTSAVTVFAGTTLTPLSGSVSYTAQIDTVISVGDTFADVPVTASVAGAAGNIPSGQTFTASPAPPGFLSASNLSAFSNGSDQETDDQRKMRFQSFVSTLARGTVDGVTYGALTSRILDGAGNIVEQVRTAIVVEPYLTDSTQPTGLIEVYIHNGVGETSLALVAQTQIVIDGYVDPLTGDKVPGWKAAGVQAVVVAATDQTVLVTGVITAKPGYSLTPLVAAVTSAISSYETTLSLGANYEASQVAAIVLAVPGAANWQPVSPTVDVAGSPTVKFLPGASVIIAIPLVAALATRSTLHASLS